MKNFFVALFLLVMACRLQPVSAQKRAFQLADVYRTVSAGVPVVSPDGKKLAMMVNRNSLKVHKGSSDIYLMNPDGTDTLCLTTDHKSYNPSWSKDGKSLYYVSSVNGELPQIYRYMMGSRKSEQLTHYKLGITNPVFSPDETCVAFQANVWPEAGADDSVNVKLTKQKDNGSVHAHYADQLLFRHWTEYRDGQYSHIILYDFAQKKYRDVTPGKFDSPAFNPSGEGDFVFSPDGKEICFASNRSKHSEANTNIDLYILSLDNGTLTNITSDNPAFDGNPQYSPNGHYIAYRKQIVPGYESDRFRLVVYDCQSKQSQTLTESFDNWVESFKWAPDSKSIYFAGDVKGYMPLYRLDLKTKKVEQLIQTQVVYEFTLSPKGEVYYMSSHTGKPLAIYSWSPKNGQSKQITHFNRTFENEVDIRPSEAFWVKGAKGDSVEYFIVKPHNFDPNKKYPLIINVHGGPQMQWMDSYRTDWQVYPGAGYVLAYPNPHGSTGYGQAFTLAISKDWGGCPYEDVMAVTDALAKLSYVDSTRMAAMGWSYGGYMMNWIQGHTKRYKCLASMMGVYDLRSMWGSTEELWFPEFELDGRPWESDLYEKWSPSMYVKNFHTPTLVLTGERDYRVPYTQSLQYFTTLQSLDIPSRLVVFRDDGHWPAGLTSMPVYYNAHLEWFHEYLGGDPAPYSTEKMINNQVEY